MAVGTGCGVSASFSSDVRRVEEMSMPVPINHYADRAILHEHCVKLDLAGDLWRLNLMNPSVIS
ncbi:hypothetical protein ABID25_005520 [Mesorhizobium abyssinicae]